MADKVKIWFIINPKSGIRRKSKISRLIEKEVDSTRFDYELFWTESAGHGAKLSKEAIDKKVNIVVAVGGDGSINEIGTALIGSEVSLGIIPAGSGNGIARSLGIHLQARKALIQILVQNRICIDTGMLGEHPFIGVAGIGFDAHIGDRFHHRKIRGKLAYGYLMMTQFHRFSPFDFRLTRQKDDQKAFVLAFANTTQYGNNAVIAPLAEFQDGKLEMVHISELPPRRVPELMVRLFNRSINKADIVETQQFESLEVIHSANIGHVDGEPVKIGSSLEVKVNPKSLWVLT